MAAPSAVTEEEEEGGIFDFATVGGSTPALTLSAVHRNIVPPP